MIKQHTPAWFEARRSLLTASNAAAALGLSKFCSRQKLWKKYVFGEDTPSNPSLEHGIKNEPVARNLYENLFGVKVYEAGLEIHDDHSWLGASADGLVGDDSLLEIKCPLYTRHLKVPLQYMIQIQVQMAVYQKKSCDVFFFYKDDYDIFHVQFDPNFFNAMVSQLKIFWDHVTTKTIVPILRRKK